MIQPHEMKLELPMQVHQDISTTSKVWAILKASYDGDLKRIKELVAECSGLIYAQYNYTPPIHFAVREGHKELVQYLLNEGALDPNKAGASSATPLAWAKKKGHTHIESLLRRTGAE